MNDVLVKLFAQQYGFDPDQLDEPEMEDMDSEPRVVFAGLVNRDELKRLYNLAVQAHALAEVAQMTGMSVAPHVLLRDACMTLLEAELRKDFQIQDDVGQIFVTVGWKVYTFTPPQRGCGGGCGGGCGCGGDDCDCDGDCDDEPDDGDAA